MKPLSPLENNPDLTRFMFLAMSILRHCNDRQYMAIFLGASKSTMDALWKRGLMTSDLYLTSKGDAILDKFEYRYGPLFEEAPGHEWSRHERN